jgi:hypothetical protein
MDIVLGVQGGKGGKAKIGIKKILKNNQIDKL